MAHVCEINFANPYYLGRYSDPALINRTQRQDLYVQVDEDIEIETESEFQSPEELLGILGQIGSLVSILGGVGGVAGSGMTRLKNLFAIPMWKNTKPVKLNLTLKFFTETDPWSDVQVPMLGLISLPILTFSQTTGAQGAYLLPGVSPSQFNVGAEEKRPTGPPNKEKNTVAESKLISLKIPNVVELPFAFVDSAKPKFSKEKTFSGASLWGSIQLSVQGITSAAANINFDFSRADLVPDLVPELFSL